jgi:hypothetical protein
LYIGVTVHIDNYPENFAWAQAGLKRRSPLLITNANSILGVPAEKNMTNIQKQGCDLLAENKGAGLPFRQTSVIVPLVLAHFGLRQSIRARNSAVFGANQIFQPGPNHARHMPT